MPGLTIKQRAKVNAALSIIYDQGYDAQGVVGWAKGYMRDGMDARAAYQQALNEFAAGQPGLHAPLTKMTRLIEASCPATVAKYDQALSAYIATGDDGALQALAPMMAADSVALAVKNGELQGGAITRASVEAALGFQLPAAQVQQAAALSVEAPAAQPSAKPPQPQTVASVATVEGAGGSSARTLLGGARTGGSYVGLGDRPRAQAPMTREQIRANYANAGVQQPTEAI